MQDRFGDGERSGIVAIFLVGYADALTANQLIGDSVLLKLGNDADDIAEVFPGNRLLIGFDNRLMDIERSN